MRLFLNKLIVGILLVSIPVLAEDKVKYLGQNDPAPYAGYLFTPEATKQLRVDAIELDGSKRLNQYYSEQINTYETRLKDYQQQNNELSSRLASSDTSFFSKAGYFIFGAVLTGMIAYGVYKTK